MVVQCPSCQSRFRVADEKVTDRGVRLRCTKCKELFHARKPDAAADGPPAGAQAPVPPKGAAAPSFDADALAQAKAAAAARAAGVRPPMAIEVTLPGKPQAAAPDPFGMDDLTGDEPAAAPPRRPRTEPQPARDEARPRTGPQQPSEARPRTGPQQTSEARPRTGPQLPASEARPRTGPLSPAAEARPRTEPQPARGEARPRTGPQRIDPPPATDGLEAPGQAPEASGSPPGYGDLELDMGGGSADPAPQEKAAPAEAGFGFEAPAQPPGGATPAEPAAPAPRAKEPPPRRQRRAAAPRRSHSAAGLLLSSALTGLLCAAAVLLGGMAWSARRPAPARAAAGSELVATRVVSGLYDTAGGNQVFFVRGRVENRGSRPRGPVRVVVELHAETGLEGRAEALAGLEPTPEDVYALRSPAEVDKLVRGLAQAEGNRTIPPGGSLPFFAVLRERPDDAEGQRLEVRIEPVEAGPARARPAAASR